MASTEKALVRPRAADGPAHRIAVVAISFVALLAGSIAAQDAPDSEVSQTRTALQKWVETRRIISDEKRDWALGRETLVNRIELVRREIDSLRSRIADAEESIAEADSDMASSTTIGLMARGYDGPLGLSISARTGRP